MKGPGRRGGKGGEGGRGGWEGQRKGRWMKEGFNAYICPVFLDGQLDSFQGSQRLDFRQAKGLMNLAEADDKVHDTGQG